MRDLAEFFDPDLHLPIRGKTYTITSPTAAEGLRLRLLINDESAPVHISAEVAEIMKLLGATLNEATGEYEGGLWGEMNADGLSWEEVFHAGQTALMHFAVSPAVAEINWEAQIGSPKVTSPGK